MLPEAGAATPAGSDANGTASDAAPAQQLATWRARRQAMLAEHAALPGKLAAATDALETLRRSVPSPPSSAGMGEDALRQAIEAAEVDLGHVNRDLEALQAAGSALSERRAALPQQLADVRASLRELGDWPTAADTPLTPGTGAPSGAAPGRATPTPKTAETPEATPRALLEAALAVYETEMQGLDLRDDLRARRLALAELKRERLQQRLVQLGEALRTAQKTRLQAEASRAEVLRRDAEDLPPSLRDAVNRVVAENEELASIWSGEEGLSQKLAMVSERLARARDMVARVESEHSRLAHEVEAASSGDAVGALLRRERKLVPDVGMFRRFVQLRQGQISAAQLQQIRLRERREDLANVDARVTRALAEADTSGLNQPERERIESLLGELYDRQLQYLDALLADHEAYFSKLLSFDAEQRELIDRSQALLDFINAHVLWVPSDAPIGADVMRHAGAAVADWLSPRWWRQVARALARLSLARPWLWLCLPVLALLLWLSRRVAGPLLHRFVADLRSPTVMDAWGPTLRALGLTLVIGAGPPLLCSWLARELGGVNVATLFVRSVAAGLQAAALTWLTLRLPRQVLRPQGIAAGHAQLSEAGCQALYRELGLLQAVLVPAAGLVFALEARGDDAARESLGRLVFLAGMLGSAVVAYRAGRAPALRAWLVDLKPPALVRRAHRPLVVAVVLLPVALMVSAALGFYFTAWQLAVRLHLTLVLLFTTVVAAGLLGGWLTRARRHVAVQRAQEALAAQAARTSAIGGSDGMGAVAGATPSLAPDRSSVAAEDVLKLDEVAAQTSRLTRTLLLFGLIVGAAGIWADLLPATAVFDRVTLWHTTREVSVAVPDPDGGETLHAEVRDLPVSLRDLGKGLLWAALTLLLLQNLPGLFEVTLFRRVKPGERYAYATIVKYAIGMAGPLLALDAVGVTWASVQWLVAAMGLGLGFGLQEIFANFISGLIILFERPIRVGDTVTIGDVSGTVHRIRIRSTWITRFDRKELVVPNKEFVTGRLINWTLSDETVRLTIHVGVAYGTNTHQAIDLLQETARKHPQVLVDPEPAVLFSSFGNSTLDFELRVYLPTPDILLGVRHNLLLDIDRRFRKAGIEIAFPQLDVHLKHSPPAADPPTADAANSTGATDPTGSTSPSLKD